MGRVGHNLKSVIIVTGNVLIACFDLLSLPFTARRPIEDKVFKKPIQN